MPKEVSFLAEHLEVVVDSVNSASMTEIPQLQIEIDRLEAEIIGRPENAHLLLECAQLKRRLGWLTSNRALAYAALDDNNRSIVLAPNDPEVWLERGMTYYTIDEQDKAIADYDRSLSIKESSRAYYNRGVSRWRRLEVRHRGSLLEKDSEIAREIDQILHDYTHAVQLNPTDADTLYNRGVVYLSLGKYAVAIADFTQLLTVDPNNGSAYLNRALCYEHSWLPRYSDKTALQRAIEDYEEAIRCNPTDRQAHFNRAICYEWIGQRGRYSDKSGLRLAIKDYDVILHHDPFDLMALYNRGWALEHLGKIDQAKEDFAQFIRHSPDGFAAGQLSVHLEQLQARRN